MLSSVVSEDEISHWDQKPHWDIAIRYADLKKLGHVSESQKIHWEQQAVQAIISRAQSLLRNVSTKNIQKEISWDEAQGSAFPTELDLEATLERPEFYLDQKLNQDLKTSSLRFTERRTAAPAVLVLMDMSLSISGEKLAFLATAAAVLASTLPWDHLALAGFGSKSLLLKAFSGKIPLNSLILKILNKPVSGFTYLEEALIQAEQWSTAEQHKRVHVVLISDGKYTEGKDPSYLAGRIPWFHAIKVGRDLGGRALLKELVDAGQGSFVEIRRERDLPEALYRLVRSLNRYT